jgi:hypothetical protein
MLNKIRVGRYGPHDRKRVRSGVFEARLGIRHPQVTIAKAGSAVKTCAFGISSLGSVDVRERRAMA